MSRPSNQERRRRALERGLDPCPECKDGWLQYHIKDDSQRCALCKYTQPSRYFDGPSMPNPPGEARLPIPADWIKGQLLNVRNIGNNQYNVTLLGEEFDPHRPERCMQFTDSFACQDFVSRWYSPDIADPRA